ncbi:MAG: hypothetical protein WA993_12960 [Candidatus Binatus sp.]|jgi:hypothetical protein
MKARVIRKARVISLMVTASMLLVLLGRGSPQIAGAAAGPTCPSPAPSCASGGNLPDFEEGTYGCTLITTNSAGGIQVQLLTITSDGEGDISGTAAVNNNNASGTTFSGFTALTTGATYCLNPNDSGYIFLAGGACPLALVIDQYAEEVRLIDTTENQAGAMTCRAQNEDG